MNTLNERITQLQQWAPVQSHNQIEEKMEQLALRLKEEVDSQKMALESVVEQAMLELAQAREAIQVEVDARELAMLREVKDEAAREHFEQERAEFLSAIQENMQVLDSMLKQYAVKQQNTAQSCASNSTSNALAIQDNEIVPQVAD